MQSLKAEISIQIPNDHVLIQKVEYDNLKQQELTGVYWTMQDLENRTGKKHEWIKENLLYPTAMKKQLDVKNGGFVYYPAGKGEKWTFQATKMAKFLEDNFYKIFG